MSSQGPLSPLDVRLMTLAVVLEPAMALARVSGLELDDLQDLVSTGYLREFQRRGMSLRGMTRRIGKSLRTLARVSKQAAEDGPPLAGSERVGWQRRVVRALAEGPRSPDELVEAFPDATGDAVRDTVDELLDAGILARDEEDRIALASEHLRLVRGDLDTRLESLRHYVSAVANVVYQRFYGTEPDAEAFARVFTFSVKPERLPKIRARLYEVLREEVFAADAEAEADPEGAVEASAILGLVETPTDVFWRQRR